MAHVISARRITALVIAVGLLAALVPGTALAKKVTYWNVAGTYGVDLTVDGDPTVYPETLILTQSGTGTITGTSICSMCFTITSGSVVGNTVTIVATNPFTLTLKGVISADGSMAGTWADGAGGLDRTGHWATTSGAAKSVGVKPQGKNGHHGHPRHHPHPKHPSHAKHASHPKHLSHLRDR